MDPELNLDTSKVPNVHTRVKGFVQCSPGVSAVRSSGRLDGNGHPPFACQAQTAVRDSIHLYPPRSRRPCACRIPAAGNPSIPG